MILCQLNVTEKDVLKELKWRKIERNFCYNNYREGINIFTKNLNRKKMINVKNNDFTNDKDFKLSFFLKLICLNI